MLWTVGMRGDKLQGKIQVIGLKNSDSITSNISVTVRKTIMKNYREARLYIDVTLSTSFRSKGKLGKSIMDKIEPKKIKEKVSFNMDFYLMSVYSYEFRDLMKYFNEFLIRRDEDSTALIPPLALDFYRILDERFREGLAEIDRVISAMEAEEIKVKFSVMGKEKNFPEPVGRVLRIISLEYSNTAHINEIKRILRRIGGITDEELKTLEKKWDEGVHRLIEMAVNYLESSPIEDNEFVGRFINGLLGGDEEKNPREIFGSIIRMLSKNSKRNMNLIKKLEELGEKIGVRKERPKTKRTASELKELINLLKENRLKEAYELASNRDMSVYLKDLEKQVKYDNETLMATILFIFFIVKREPKKLVKFVKRLMYGKKTTLGIIADSIEALNDSNEKKLRDIYIKLSEQIAFFSYSTDLVRFPHNIIVTSMYMILTEVARKIGNKEAEIRAKKVANKLLEKIGLN